MDQFYNRALDVIAENLSSAKNMAFATCGDKIDVRFCHGIYYKGKVYSMAHDDHTRLSEIAVNPAVAMCLERSKFYGNAKDIGHPADLPDEQLRKFFKRMLPGEYYNELDNTLHVIEVTLTSAVVYSAYHCYKVDLVSQSVVRERCMPTHLTNRH